METQIGTDKINIVFASDNNYAQHAAVAMVSILMNTSMSQRIAFFLLDDNIAESVRKKMEATISPWGASLTFIKVDVTSFKDLFVSGQLSRTAYFRLEMAKWLPDTVTKAVYLDCDLLVRDDIVKLWNIDLQGKPLAAVPDYGIMASSKDWSRKQETLQIHPDDMYFNSGVLVIDIQQWREQKYGEQVETLAKTHDYQHHDQDALNYLFMRNWQVLPLRWNVIPPIWNMFWKVLLRKRFRISALAARRDIAILHYAGGYKPWEYKEYAAFNHDYYKCLAKSAFSRESMPQPDNRRKNRSIKRQLFRIYWGDFWQKFYEKLS